MTNDSEVIMTVAKRLLSQEGQTEVEIDLADGNTRTAVWALIGAIDGSCAVGRISKSEAEEFYQQLEMTKEESSRFRRHH